MSSRSTPLPLELCKIIDKIGSPDSFFPTETPEFAIPGTRTPETLALEESLRNLVARFQELEIKLKHSEPEPAKVQVNKVGGGEKGVCGSCGHRLESVPLTPGESPTPVVEGKPYVPRSITAGTSVFDGVDVDVTSNNLASVAISSDTPSDAAVYPSHN
jgi:hypothetical protein